MSVLAPTRPRFIYCRAGNVSRPAAPDPGRLLDGDAVTQLRTLRPSSVDCVITSPPYFLLRNYGHDDQIGLERTVDDWVDQLSAVMAEVARVLKPTGSVWLNLGDSFSRGTRYGAPSKSLLLGPERLLLALSEAGWIVRNKIVWAKPNPMPASVRDRLTCSWEPIYFLVRSSDYFFDLDVAREPHNSRKPSSTSVREGKYESANPTWAGPLAGKNDGLLRARSEGRAGHPLGKNPGDVWRVSTATFKGAHFAVYPERLIERPMKLSCPERVCRLCGRPWQREVRRDRPGDLQPDCRCEVGWQPGVVLDPFMGSGTTAIVAERLGRRWIGVELNPEYADLTRNRVATARSENVRQPLRRGPGKTRTTHQTKDDAEAGRDLRQPYLRMSNGHQSQSPAEPTAPHSHHPDPGPRQSNDDQAQGFEDVVRLVDGTEHHTGNRRQNDRPATGQDGLEPLAQIGQFSAEPCRFDLKPLDRRKRLQPLWRRVDEGSEGTQPDSRRRCNQTNHVHRQIMTDATDNERDEQHVNGGTNA